jgi:glycine/D-amino acid oxidase-like deaminating enzyme
MPTDLDVTGAKYRSLSFWFDSLDEELSPRPALDRDIHVDVAIVGAGYSGLWTAYYLKQRDPSLRIAIVEKEIAGFGASGRNGGWCSALFATKRERLAKKRGRDAAVAMQRAMFQTVDEVGSVLEREGIDADFLKGGTLAVATAPAHVHRLKEEIAYERSWGFGEEDVRWLDRREAAARIGVSGILGATYTPHCARVHPARLARGLARAVEDAGVALYERTPALSVAPRLVSTVRGDVHANVVVMAIEGYTATMPGHHRRVVPLYSLMIATEPLPPSFWKEVGWSGYETMTDGRHLLIYAQRTSDDRIAFGGRGAPYHFGSSVKPEFDRDEDVFVALQRELAKLWTAASDARITHAWGGPLGLTRDWASSVGYEPYTGFAWAGGYVGDGVSTTNLAGRTLADLITGTSSELTDLPWVNHRSRSWEPEPFRWLGANLALRAMGSADRAEARSGKPAKRAQLVGRLIGH